MSGRLLSFYSRCGICQTAFALLSALILLNPPALKAQAGSVLNIEGLTLSAPKGMLESNGTLHIADISLRKIVMVPISGGGGTLLNISGLTSDFSPQDMLKLGETLYIRRVAR